jgi:uncharacterized protein YllA (UPF0747 family)
MVKKSVVKKTKTSSEIQHKKPVHKPRLTQTSSEVKVEKILVENFVSLQKVMTNLSVKFDSLTSQISKLLELFEISAKSLAQKDFGAEKGYKDEKKIIEKIDNLAEQNKTIARGLTLIHDRNSQEIPYEPSIREPQPPPKLPPLKRLMTKPTQNQKQVDVGGYEKSISSKPEFK